MRKLYCPHTRTCQIVTKRKVRHAREEYFDNKARDNRAVLVAGLLFVAAWIIGLGIAFPPPVKASADTLTTYYQGHAGLAMLQVYVANGLTGVLLLIFVAALHNAFRSADGESSTTSNILL